MNRSKSKSNNKKFYSTPWKNPQQWMEDVQGKADEIAQSQGYQDYNDAVAQGATTSGNSGKHVSDIDKPQPTIKDPYVPGTTFGDMFGPPKLETGTPHTRPNPIIDTTVPDHKTPINVPDTFVPPLAEDQVNPPDHPSLNPPPDDDPKPSDITNPTKGTTSDTNDVPEEGGDQTMMYVLYGMLAIVGIGALYFLYQSATTPAPRPYVPPPVNLRASEYFEPSVYDAANMLPE